jgi:hypothetical protein
MKPLIAFVWFLLLCAYTSSAQDDTVSVYFEIDGAQATYKSGKTQFIYNSDTITIDIHSSKLFIPATVVKQKTTVIFYIDNYILKFDSIPVTWNKLNPQWTLGIATKPFDKKIFWMVKSWKNVQVVYYLKNEDGRIFTVDDCKKSKVITRS